MTLSLFARKGGSQTALHAARKRTQDSWRSHSILSSLIQSKPIANLRNDGEEKKLALPRISAVPLSTHISEYSTKPPPDSSPKFDADLDDGHPEDYSSRLKNARRDMRQRAGHFRDNARQNYKDFKDDPRSRTAAGAKSVTTMMKHYGPVFVATYFSIYFATLGSLFLGVESGLLDPAALFSMLGHASTEGAAQGETTSTVQLVVDFMHNHAWLDPYAHYFEKNPQVANLAVAWIAVKFTEPVRLGLSMAITPRIARYLGYSKAKVVVESELAVDDKIEDDAEKGKAEKSR